MKTRLLSLLVLAGLLWMTGCASEEQGKGGSTGSTESTEGRAYTPGHGYWDHGYWYPY